MLKKKDQLHSLNISEVIDSEECGYLNSRKLLFGSEHVNGSQTLLKAAR